MPIRLGVNVDHVATLRQVRGDTTPYPDVMAAAKQAIAAGAVQITMHLREDRRHIQDKDIFAMAHERPALFNLEMAASKEMKEIALSCLPDWVCLVPEKRRELTTEGGLDIVKQKKKLKKYIHDLQEAGIFVSLFLAPSKNQIECAAELGADAVELHTGHWVLWQGEKKRREFKNLVEAARLAHSHDLNVHAGHGLDFEHAKMIKKLPYLEEVNIGHSIICYSIEMGLTKAVKQMKSILL